ncbi:MAG TPA: leucyl aminopeptidase [Candidatus Limnocylindria bacterium]|nr:leucyl aminopeptidase [Candidatus Limnocylindria bacterium]
MVSSLEGEHLDAVIVPVFKEGDAAGNTPADIKGTAEWVAKEHGDTKLFAPITHLQSNGDGSTRLVVVGAGKRVEMDVARAWQFASAGVRGLWQSTARRIAIVLESDAVDAQEAVQSAVEGVIYAMWRPESHRTTEKDRYLPPLEDVLLVIGGDAGGYGDAISRGTFVAEAVNWARGIANEPANLMTPTHMAQAARDMASQTSLKVEVLGEDEARDLGMGSFLSVARGSDEPAQVVVLRHQGRAGDGYDLALVGKGITFDSGGISIKPADEMHLMKYDMSGAASVLAVAGVVSRLNLPLNLIAVGMCTENLPGGHATKPGDVVTSMSGKTVEVTNTDAEGRLVLIDGITYAQREGAKRVVDVATLTGAVRVALGRLYTGVLGRPESFIDEVLGAADRSGERMWPLPLADEHREEMKSEVADLRNSSGGRLGGTILGAAFIDAAVDADTEWAHLDIASTAWYEEERPFSPKGPQGAAVRTLVELASTIAKQGA